MCYRALFFSLLIILCLSYARRSAAELQDFRPAPGKMSVTPVDGVPFLVETRHGRHIFCLIEKNGSSRLKALLVLAHTRLSLNELAGLGNIHEAALQMPWIGAMNETAYLRSLNEHNLPRFVVVRNPYTRLLSGYLNRYSRTFWEIPKVDTFAEFVDAMFEFWTVKGRLPTVDGHFTPQTDHCWINQGYGYDYYLKLEKVGCWLKDLLTVLGVHELGSMPWEVINHSFNSYSYPCFYSPRDMHCSTYWDPATLSPCECEVAERNDTGHVTNASGKMNEYYTPEVANKVYRMFQRDFEVLGYKKWNPNSWFDPC